MPTPSISFEGASNNDNGIYNLGYLLPPDTEGAAGVNYYVQVTNMMVEVFDKASGTNVATESLSSLFGATNVCGAYAFGDATVLYDADASRWLVSEIAASGVNFITGAPSAPFYQCVAVSQGSDPAGSYYLYALQIANNYLNDYPKFGVWPDAYYMSANLFSGHNFNTYNGVGVYAWDRSAMLNGQAPYVVYQNLGTGVFSMLPANWTGSTAPPSGEPGHFVGLNSTVLGDSSNSLRVFDFHVDWATTSNSSVTEQPAGPVAVAAFNPNVCSSEPTCVPQPGTSALLWTLSDRLMFPLQYRNFGTYETMVTNHTIKGSSGQAALRYYELSRNVGDSNFSLADQGTYAPDSNYRWMGSAGLDKQGDLVVGYSVSSSSVYPSIRYAGRPYGQTGGLTIGETSLMAGNGSQTDSSGRWGDYSGLSIDPTDGCKFWYTNEYYSPTSQYLWQTRIGSFTFPNCQ